MTTVRVVGGEVDDNEVMTTRVSIVATKGIAR